MSITSPDTMRSMHSSIPLATDDAQITLIYVALCIPRHGENQHKNIVSSPTLRKKQLLILYSSVTIRGDCGFLHIQQCLECFDLCVLSWVSFAPFPLRLPHQYAGPPVTTTRQISASTWATFSTLHLQHSRYVPHFARKTRDAEAFDTPEMEPTNSVNSSMQLCECSRIYFQ